MTNSYKAHRKWNLDLLAMGQHMSGPLWVRSGRSWCEQDHAAPKEMFQIAAAGWRGRSLFILQTAFTKAELHPVTSFSRLRRRECLHRAVKTQCCERLAAAAPRMPAATRESSFASSAPAKRFHGRKGLFGAHGTASFALQIASAFPMAAAQQQGSIFLWEGNKLLHHCDLCAVSC